MAITDIYTGGDIVTLDPDNPSAEAVAVGGGVVVAVGGRNEVLAQHPDAEEVDLAGGCLFPSFTDHHLHLTAIGLALLNKEEDERLFIDLAGAASAEAIVERVAERAAHLPHGNWILGMGWNQHDWGTPVLPDHGALSRAVPDHPVFLVRIDAHSAWVNQAALDIAGFSADTPDPHGGRILRHADGSPQGMLLERAVEPMLEHVPATTGGEQRAALKLAAHAMAARGVTEVFDAGFMAPPAIVSMGVDLEGTLELLIEADAEEPLPIDVSLMVPSPSSLADSIVADPDAYQALSERIRVTHIKLYADGAFGSRGAALTHPYADDRSTSGFMRMSDEELEHETRRAIDAGLGISTHAIGDDAVHRVLRAYCKVADEIGDVDPGRFRIEHFAYSSLEDQRQAATRGFLLVAQPNFIDPDNEGRTMEDGRLGPENGDRVYPWKSLHDAGANLALSSDYYLAPGPPLLDVYTAHTRANRTGNPAGGWQPQERLAREESLRLATASHRGAGGSPVAGVIRVGKPADLVVLSANPLTVEGSRLLDIEVRTTLRRGCAVFVA